MFIVHCNCVAVPIYWLLSAASHCSITAFKVKMSLNFIRQRNAVTSNRVQCGNATQLWHRMNGPSHKSETCVWKDMQYHRNQVGLMFLSMLRPCLITNYGKFWQIWENGFASNDFLHQVVKQCHILITVHAWKYESNVQFD